MHPEIRVQPAASAHELLDARGVDPVRKYQPGSAYVQPGLQAQEIPQVAVHLCNNPEPVTQVRRQTDIDVDVLLSEVVLQHHAGTVKIHVAASAGKITPVQTAVDESDVSAQDEIDQFFRTPGGLSFIQLKALYHPFAVGVAFDEQLGPVQTDFADHRHHEPDRIDVIKREVGFRQGEQRFLAALLVDDKVQHLQPRRKPVHVRIQRTDADGKTDLLADAAFDLCDIPGCMRQQRTQHGEDDSQHNQRDCH